MKKRTLVVALLPFLALASCSDPEGSVTDPTTSGTVAETPTGSTTSDATTAYVDCLVELGFAAVVGPDGAVLYEAPANGSVSSDDLTDQAVAESTCQERVPAYSAPDLDETP
jgi:hypothetical protein